MLRLYESTPALPPVICLTGQRSSSDGQVTVDRMRFDLYWMDDNLMTIDVGRKYTSCRYFESEWGPQLFEMYAVDLN